MLSSRLVQCFVVALPSFLCQTLKEFILANFVVYRTVLFVVYSQYILHIAMLTLILSDPKVICLCHHPCSLTSLYTVGWPTSSSYLDIPKMKMDSAKNGRWIFPFKKFGRLGTFRVRVAMYNWPHTVPQNNSNMTHGRMRCSYIYVCSITFIWT